MRGLRTAPVICAKMEASWSAQDFRQTSVTPSGPGAFLLLFILKTLRTSSSLICSAGVGVAGGVNGVSSHSDCLPVVDSPQCWRMVSCNLW